MERRRRAAFSGTDAERNAVTEPQTEATVSAVNQESPARDERGRYGAEQAWSRRRDSGRDRKRVERSKARVGHGGRWDANEYAAQERL